MRHLPREELARPGPGTAGSARVLVASNRGPVVFAPTDAGGLTARRGSGGLVSGMQEVVREAGLDDAGPEAAGLVWVCAALSDADRRAVRGAPGGRLDRAGFDTGGAAVHMLDVDGVVFERAYNGIANRTLWFVLHMLFSPAHDPSFGTTFWRDWEAYETYNAMFAAALAAEAAPGAAVLIQDYHLMLVPGQLREMRPDLRISHFTHTPWAPPDYFGILPDRVSRAVLGGMLGADRVGFLTERWAAAFRDCARALLDLDVRDHAIVRDGRTIEIGVHPLGVDVPALRARAAAPDVAARAADLREFVGDRQLIVRVDRTELSKNIVRGLEAYRELLRLHPYWRGRVTHLVCAYPSRHDLPEYREYTAAVRRIAAEICDEFATDAWSPLRLEVTDDYPRSLAALSLADVLVVNPIRDGMNLIAKEGPAVSCRDVALVLSQEAGAHAELAPDALVVNPFDVSATAAALDAALRMPVAARRARAARLAARAGRLPPGEWFRQQLAALPAGPPARTGALSPSVPRGRAEV